MRRAFLLGLLLLASLSLSLDAYAQWRDGETPDDFGIWTSVHIRHQVNEFWNIGASAEVRTRDNTKNLDRYFFMFANTFKLTKWLSMTMYNDYLVYNTYATASSPSHKQEQYLFLLFLTATKRWGDFYASFREGWFYYYIPETEFHKNQLRHKIEIGYNIPNTKFKPYMSAEGFTTKQFDRWRFYWGSTYKIDKHNTINLFYEYQLVRTHAWGDHIAGISYTLNI